MFSFDKISYFPVGKITSILFYVLELVGHGTEALLLEELMRLKELGLTQDEVCDRYAPLWLHLSL